MLSLTLNGLPAVLKAGASFKLTRQNPYFKTQGDYTLEVTLPLEGCAANQRIFGSLHRPETALTPYVGRKYAMQLLAPPLALEGSATVTAVTHEEVKVQLTAGVSDLAHALEDTVQYIDKMELGNAWDGFAPFSNRADDWEPGLSREEMAKIFSFKPTNLAPGGFTVEQMMHGTFRETDAVCFPVIADTDGTMVNPTGTANGVSGGQYALYLYKSASEGDIAATTALDEQNIAAQPYLCDMLPRVIRGLGYEVGDLSFLTDGWTSGLLIANSRATISRAETLPHWTPAELIEEMQQAFGGVFTVSEERRVSFVSRRQWYGAQAAAVELAAVADARQAELDEEGEQQTSSAGNVDYDWPASDDMLTLPAEVRERAQWSRHSTMAAVRAAVAALSAKERAKSKTLYYCTADHSVHALLHRKDEPETYELARVGQCPGLVRLAAADDNATALRIVPARMAVAAYFLTSDPHAYTEGTIETGIPVLRVADTSLVSRAWYSVDAAINPDTAEQDERYTDSEKTHLELAYYNGDVQFNASITTTPLMVGCPVGVPFVSDPQTGFLQTPARIADRSDGRGPSLDWYRLDPLENTADQTRDCIGQFLDGGAQIDTRCALTLDIYDRFALDPTRPYLIRSRRYACDRLEITLTEEGVQLPVRGTFYEIQTP